MLTTFHPLSAVASVSSIEYHAVKAGDHENSQNDELEFVKIPVVQSSRPVLSLF